MDHCEEYVGNATPTGYRKVCGKPSAWMAVLRGASNGVIALCDRHVKDYQGQLDWRVVHLVRS